MAIAVAILALFALALIALAYRSRTIELTEDQQRHVDALRMQLEAKTPRRLRLDIEADFDARRGDLRRLWTATDDWSGSDDPTVGQALREVHDTIFERWETTTGPIPHFALRLGEEAVVVFVLGALAVISVERWEAWLSAQSPRPEPGSIVATLHSATMTVLEMGQAGIGYFPYGDMVWALSLGYSILFYQWLYHNWWLLSLVLIAGAVLITVLDRRLELEETEVFDDRRRIAFRIVMALGAIWAVGVIPTLAGQAAGIERLGAAAGFLLAFVTGIAFAYIGAVRAWRRLTRAGGSGETGLPIPANRSSKTVSYPTLVGSYLLARRLWLGIGVVAATLIPIYLLVLIADGRLLELIGAFRSASTEMTVLIGLVTVSLVALVAKVVEDAWADLRAATRTALASQSVRLAVFGRALPYGTMVLTYLIASGLQLPIVMSVALAIVAGVIARVAYVLFARVKYRNQLREPREREVSRVLVEAWTLEDADDEEHYVARVNGERLARARVDDLVDEVIEQARHLREEGEFAQTFGRHHVKNLLEYGYVDENDSRQELRVEIQHTIENELKRRNGRAPKSAIDEALEEYPDTVVEEKQRDLRVHGARKWRLIRRGDYFLMT